MNRERRRSESLTSPSRLARHLRRNALFREVRKLTRAGDVLSSCAARIMSSKDWVLLGRMFVMTSPVSCGDADGWADVTSSCVAKDASSKDWVLLGRMFVMTLVSCGDADVTSSCIAKDASSKDWVLLDLVRHVACWWWDTRIQG